MPRSFNILLNKYGPMSVPCRGSTVIRPPKYTLSWPFAVLKVQPLDCRSFLSSLAVTNYSNQFCLLLQKKRNQACSSSSLRAFPSFVFHAISPFALPPWITAAAAEGLENSVSLVNQEPVFLYQRAVGNEFLALSYDIGIALGRRTLPQNGSGAVKIPRNRSRCADPAPQLPLYGRGARRRAGHSGWVERSARECRIRGPEGAAGCATETPPCLRDQIREASSRQPDFAPT
jgi:hypothetical protein